MADEVELFEGEVEEGLPLPEVAVVRRSEGDSATRGWRLGVELVQQTWRMS